jgi:hypothetical protein
MSAQPFSFRIAPTYNFARSAHLTLCEVHVRFRLFPWVFALFLFSVPGFAQKINPPQPPSPRGDIAPPIADEDEARARITSEMLKKAAKERVAALKNDTDKLLRLSVELKQSVDKSNENVLSVDIIKKAEEIEKLARSVKDKMKGPN